MMKKLIIILMIFFPVLLFAQDLQVITHGLTKADTLGKEIIFDFEVINISNQEQTVFEVRTQNNLPPEWTSSLCFGELCFPPSFDSIATSPPNPEPPLQPGDTLITSLHVFTQTNHGTANVQIQIGTFANPQTRITLDFVATTDLTNIEEEPGPPKEYFLAQNYPNPFNPTTEIKFGLKESGNVSLKVYNILGSEVATLVNGFLPNGNYTATFNASDLSSGIYIYRLVTNSFVETRKMILEK